MWVLWLVLVLLVVGVGYCARYSRYVIPADHVGIVQRRFGPADLRFRTVSPNGLRGWQARTLPPGQPSWLLPVLYQVETVPRVHVPSWHIGLVIAKEGSQRPAGHKLGKAVACDNFQDGQAFLLAGGEQGPQVATLAGGQAYYINPRLFDVQIVPNVSVPPGTVGLVNAKDGTVRPPHRRFGRHVECQGFQDGQAFLDGGGEQGPQLAVLAGGTSYDINPWLFHVTTTANCHQAGDGVTVNHLADVTVPVGYTGVVITLDGAERHETDTDVVGPIVPGHDNFRLPWIFLNGGGWRGVQAETLGEGTVLPLNPWFVRVILIPTKLLTLEWHNKDATDARNYDALLGRIVVNIQGYRLHVDMSQNLRIPRAAAPKLVSAFGGTDNSPLGGVINDPRPVQGFVNKVLGRTVESYISGIASAATIDEFLHKYSETRTDLAAQLRNALLAWGVEAVTTNLGSFQAEDAKLNEKLQTVADEQIDRARLLAKLENAPLADQIDEYEKRREQRRVQLEFEELIRLIGPTNATLIRTIQESVHFPVPQYIGSGDIAEIVNTLPAFQLQTLVGQLRAFSTDGQLPAGPDDERETPPDQT